MPVLPDGTVMMPTGLGGRAFNMEGLVPGTVIDHRFVTYAGASPKGFDGGGFYFQDHDLGRNPNPVLLSRYVVLTPPGMDLDPSTRNYHEDPKVEELDGLTATVWEKRDMPRIESERRMPPVTEIVPIVDYSHPPTMEDANWSYLGGGAGNWPTPVLEVAVAEAVKAGMSDVEKLHAIYDFVNSEITGDFGMGGSPASILLEKAGDRGQLFEAMVREAGIPYRMGRAMPWRGEGRDLTRPTSSVFSAAFLWMEPRDGAEHAFEIHSEARRCLLEGLDDIGLTLQRSAAIETFEARYKPDMPWIYAQS